MKFLIQVKMNISIVQYKHNYSIKAYCTLSKVVKSFQLRVQVADMGGMGLTSEGVAIIDVSDINNHAPQFSPVSVSVQQ